MKTTRLVRIAAGSILKNKMRASLTMLGIVIGVAAVMVMIAIGSGARSTIRRQIDNLGSNMIMIVPGSTTQGGVSQGAASFNRLTIEDVALLQREGELLAGVSPVVMVRAQVVGGLGNWRSMVNGVSADYRAIRDWPVAAGAFFSEADVQGIRKVAVLGQTVARNLFPEVDPVGSELRLRNVPFTVVGVLDAKGQTAGGMDQDDVILIPYTTARTRLSGSNFVGQILVSARSAEAIPAAQEEARQLMRESHALAEHEPDDFTVRNQDELAQAAQGTTRVMSYLLAAIASVSLVVGGIGIMNIMLVSVTERTHEIGIRMAVGARGSDVLTQFLVESIVMSSLGGVIGIVIGVFGSVLLARLTGWTTSTPLSAALLAVTFSMGVGVFFGFYPARKASRLRPIDALRHE
jgi:putative ABC transport system permease protein